jgi:AcrR family transcriptional regulator
MPRTPAQPGVDRRQQILEAALDAFAEHGFEGATTTQIAARAKATQGLLYFYFPKGKEELFAAAFAHYADNIFGSLDLAPLLAEEAAPEQVLRRFVARFVAVMGSERCLSMTRVLWRTMASAGAGGDRVSEAKRCGIAHVQHVVSQLADYLATQSARGALRPMDAPTTARLIIGGMLMLLRMSDPQELTEEHQAALASQMATLYIHGLLPDARQGSREDDMRDETARQ